MRVDVRIDKAAFEKGLLEALRKKVELALRQSAPAIRRRIGDLCTSLIAGTPEHASLVHGELMGEFGIVDARERLDGILAAIARGVEINVLRPSVVAGQIQGGLWVGMIKSDYEDVLQLAEAGYVSQPSGEEVPWLQWLVTGGDQVVVFTHRIIRNLDAAQKARSRTGQALMIPDGSGWHVPHWAAGFAENNFLTRAFDVAGVEQYFAKIFEEEFGRRMAT